MTKSTPKKTDPLTLEEVKAAADTLFPLFNEVHNRMPEGSTTADTLKIMEVVSKLGHKTRADIAEKKRKEKFGFNKEQEETK